MWHDLSIAAINILAKRRGQRTIVNFTAAAHRICAKLNAASTILSLACLVFSQPTITAIYSLIIVPFIHSCDSSLPRDLTEYIIMEIITQQHSSTSLSFHFHEWTPTVHRQMIYQAGPLTDQRDSLAGKNNNFWSLYTHITIRVEHIDSLPCQLCCIVFYY